MSAPLLLSAVTVVVGAAIVGFSLAQGRRVAIDVRDYLGDVELSAPPLDEFQLKLAEPFHLRVLRALGIRAVRSVLRLTPRHYLDGIDHKLVLAGRSGKVRAEEFVARQAGLAGAVGGMAVALVVATRPSSRMAVGLLVGLPLVALLLPSARLNRQVSERQQAILRDLPDTLDLLAISVEAGMGFEGALDVVSQRFQSPLADEFTRTLREMELGLPRREAFQNLKARTEVPELSNFILALLQADALGIPIGRVLKTQALEMRSKRRMWAREKAGKLPVKILFPLVLFIFPPIMVVVMGPAGLSLMGGMG